MRYEVPFNSQFQLIDISISPQSESVSEDKLFIGSEVLRQNIRRGNTVIQQFDEDFNLVSTQWGRRGQQKFFDLHQEYVQYNLR